MIICFPYQPLYVSDRIGHGVKCIGDNGEELTLDQYHSIYGQRGSVYDTEKGNFKYVSAEERDEIIRALEDGETPDKRESIFKD